MLAGEKVNWKVHFKVEKWHTTPDEGDPYEVVEGDGNMLVNAGAQLLLDLLIGAGGSAFNNANAALGVGDDTTAAVASQTDLQAATNKFRAPMDSTFPSRSAETVTFRASFGPSDANFDWEEWAIFNNSSGGTMLNRKVQSFGTKSGGTWAFTVTITVS